MGNIKKCETKEARENKDNRKLALVPKFLGTGKWWICSNDNLRRMLLSKHKKNYSRLSLSDLFILNLENLA